MLGWTCAVHGRDPRQGGSGHVATTVSHTVRRQPVTDPGSARPSARSGPSRVLPREASLRERLVARDEQALVELVDLATPWLLGVAQAMLQDRDEAEEVVLETFRTAWDSVTSADDGHTGLMPYLLRVVRHRALDRLRGRRRRERLHDRVAVEWSRGGVPPVEPDEAGHPGWQVHTKVHAALDQLPPEQRATVYLAYFGGLTQSEIAAQLGVPLGTVKTRLRLAFGRLRGALADLKDWVV